MDSGSTSSDVAHTVKSFRVAQGLTQDQVRQRTRRGRGKPRLSNPTITAIENPCSDVREGSLRIYAKAVGCPYLDLIAMREQERAQRTHRPGVV